MDVRRWTELVAAAERLCSEIENTGDHGAGAFDDSCSICRAIFDTRAAIANAPAAKGTGDSPRAKS